MNRAADVAVVAIEVPAICAADVSVARACANLRFLNVSGGVKNLAVGSIVLLDGAIGALRLATSDGFQFFQRVS